MLTSVPLFAGGPARFQQGHPLVLKQITTSIIFAFWALISLWNRKCLSVPPSTHFPIVGTCRYAAEATLGNPSQWSERPRSPMRFRISLLGALDLASHSRASSMLSSGELQWSCVIIFVKTCDLPWIYLASKLRHDLHTHTHTHTYIYIYTHAHFLSDPYDFTFTSHSNLSASVWTTPCFASQTSRGSQRCAMVHPIDFSSGHIVRDSGYGRSYGNLLVRVTRIKRSSKDQLIIWYGGFLKWGYPQIIHFNWISPY